MKHQVIFIRGADVFDTRKQFLEFLRKRKYKPFDNERRWTDWLEWSLSEKFQSFTPLMPNKQWGDYEAWKIWFEKILPYINKDIKVKLILIGQSFGGTFVAKYLSENKFPKKIAQLHLVSPVYESKGMGIEKMGTFRFDPKKLKNIIPQTEKIFIYHSKDDDAVPFEHSKKYLKYLTTATFHQFADRGHFRQPAFMEILQVINDNL